MQTKLVDLHFSSAGHGMGYPMTYARVVGRSHLQGDYTATTGNEANDLRNGIAGDLRRLEKDQRDELHLKRYAELSGATPEQVKIVLDLFFGSAFGKGLYGIGCPPLITPLIKES